MPKMTSNDEFIEKVRSVHGDRFDYSKLEYAGNKNKLNVVDLDGIEYSIIAKNLTRGDVPSIQSALNKNLAFEIRSRKLHGDKYDYSKSEYIDAVSKVKIICPIHGEFEQVANNHLTGRGCYLCGLDSTRESSTESIDSVRSRDLCVNKNIRVLQRIENDSKRVLIEDNLGIKYIVLINKLLSGRVPSILTAINKTEAFKTKATFKHNGAYSYEKLNYINSDLNITITCPIHGDFIQSPKGHLSGKGCYGCARDRIAIANRINSTGWTISDWIKAGESSKSFIGYRVYILECFNEDERFIKIGRTFNPINVRYMCESRMPYEYNVITEIEGGAHHMFKLESKLKRLCKAFRYSVKIPFGGMYECFTPDCLELLKDYINKE